MATVNGTGDTDFIHMAGDTGWSQAAATKSPSFNFTGGQAGADLVIRLASTTGPGGRRFV